jgi:putative phosphotransacetylase
LELFEQEVVKRVVEQVISTELIEVEASGRHVHLDRQTVDLLFGKGYQLTKLRELSQPGQYVCEERITLTGPKGSIKNVVILGPERNKSQVEISFTDALIMGIRNVPVRDSGNTDETPSIRLESGENSVQLENGTIVAKRHIHMTPEDAKRFQVTDKEIVRVKVFGMRPLIFDDVLVRVDRRYVTRMHIDYDEANACGFKKGMYGMLMKKQQGGA